VEISTVIGLVFGFGALLVAFIMEGGSPAGLIQPSAGLIVFGGTFAATMINYPLKEFLALPKLIIMAIKPTVIEAESLIETFVQLADKARREGLLSLEEEAQRIEDPFLRRGIMLVVDGVSSEMVREIMESEITNMEERHRAGYGMLEGMGGYAPTMGIVGTVMGLVSVLSSLESNPEGLGEKIAVAFIATLYGIASANLVWLPIGGKLKGFSEKEAAMREMIVEGVLAVQGGENPRIVRERLETYLAPAGRGKEGGAREGAAATAAAGAQA